MAGLIVRRVLPGDGPAVGRVALVVGLDGDGHLLELVGLVTTRRRGPPPADYRHLLSEVLAGPGGQTGGADVLGKGDGLGQGQDGEVIVQSAGVVLRVVSDGGEAPSVKVVVIDLVLANQDGDGGGGLAGSAVGGREDVLGGDEGTATPGVAPASTHQGHLPGVLVSLGHHSSHNPVPVGLPAGAGAGGQGGASHRGLGGGGGGL